LVVSVTNTSLNQNFLNILESERKTGFDWFNFGLEIELLTLFLPDLIQFYKIHVEEYFEHFSSYRYYHMRFHRQTLAISCRIVCSIQMEKSMKEF